MGRSNPAAPLAAAVRCGRVRYRRKVDIVDHVARDACRTEHDGDRDAIGAL